MKNDPISDLLARLATYLLNFGYAEVQETNFPDMGPVHLLITKRRLAVRYLCVTHEFQANVRNVNQGKVVFDQIRDYLTRQYAITPFGKELGTFVIFLCSHELYEQLKSQVNLFRDITGLHRNVMMGTVFIDREQFTSMAVETWGLWYVETHLAGDKNGSL